MTRGGFTMIEIVLVVALVGVLATIAIASFDSFQDRARRSQALVDLRALSTMLTAHFIETDALPATLLELDPDAAAMRDPWGNPYEYQRVPGSPIGTLRKDKFLVPINSDYDLYSRGPDGETRKPLQAAESRDDVIRAGNGAYYGPAENY